MLSDKDRQILYVSKPCGCIALVLTLDPTADRAKIAKVKRVAKRRGYKLEWISSEKYWMRSWECPEHQAIRVRLAREKVAHQEGLALKG